MMDQAQEADFVAAAQSGDRKAFLELVAHYKGPIYRLLYALTRSAGDSYELAQEAFTRAWQSMAEFPTGRRFLPWVLKIARNLPATLAASGPDGGDGDRLLSVFGELRADDQVAMALCLVERMRYEEIAALLDVPASMAILRISQARGLLLSRAGESESVTA
jgi:RNA polymerase sigma-70 factor (ECF subfamily)